MAPSTFPPGLTAEEWAEASLCRVGDAWEPKPPRRHALATLALHGQPFGFTWEDVDLLRRVREEGIYQNVVSDEVMDAADSVAGRIAALLPPR